MDKQKLLGQIAVFLLCVFLGFVMSIQYSSVKLRKDRTEGARTDELQELLTAEKEKTEVLQNQITQMQSTIDNYRDSIEHSGSAYKGMEKDLAKAETLAGLSDVYGTGIILTLEDAKVIDTGGQPENYIIHDYDLRNVVNELKAAGAEAISVNGERIISTTSIRCVGPTIIVNNSRKSTPFEIKAIGNSDVLENSLNMTGGVLSELKPWKIGINIQKSDKVEIKAYSGALNFNYATTAKTKENQ